jgi:hypothetical protein
VQLPAGTNTNEETGDLIIEDAKPGLAGRQLDGFGVVSATGILSSTRDIIGVRPNQL